MFLMGNWRNYVKGRVVVAVALALLAIGFHFVGLPFSRGDRGYYSSPAGPRAAQTVYAQQAGPQATPSSCPGHTHYYYPPC